VTSTYRDDAMARRCPTCRCELDGVPEDAPHRPFCSERCKAIDLGNWLDEVYRIPRSPSDDREDDVGRN
jgi:endogenous inhibitor of DNA gyrase (YacG/DUF329 family)